MARGGGNHLDHLERYYKELVRFLARTIGDAQAASDVAHDAYVRVLARDGGSIAQPRAFLYRTAVNLSVDRFRRDRTRECESLDHPGAEELHAVDAAPDVRLGDVQRLALIERALDELPQLCSQAFLLRKIDGLSHAEIAGQLGISKALVEKHIVNAMSHCRNRLRDWGAA